MKNNIKILIVQNNAVIGERLGNFKRVSELLKPYENSCPDLIVFPELWNVGWYCSIYPQVAEENGFCETVSFLSELAKKFNSNVVGGSYVRKHSESELRNTCPVFNRKGELIAQYDKMHLYAHLGEDEDKYATVGNNPVIASTDIGNLGISICYDIRFPELFRKYAFNGADILINMAAWPKTRENHWTTLQKARAIENQSFMIAVSQTGKIKDDAYNLGHSMVINPYGDVIASLNEEEAVLECKINLEEMSSLRTKIPTLLDVQEKYEFVEKE